MKYLYQRSFLRVGCKILDLKIVRMWYKMWFHDSQKVTLFAKAYMDGNFRWFFQKHSDRFGCFHTECNAVSDGCGIGEHQNILVWKLILQWSYLRILKPWTQIFLSLPILHWIPLLFSKPSLAKTAKECWSLWMTLRWWTNTCTISSWSILHCM